MFWPHCCWSRMLGKVPEGCHAAKHLKPERPQGCFSSAETRAAQFSEAAPGQRIRTMSTLPLDTGWKPHVSVWKSVTCRFAIFISVTLLFGDPSARTGGLLVHYSHFSKDSCTRQCKVLIDIKGHFSTKLLSLRCPQR